MKEYLKILSYIKEYLGSAILNIVFNIFSTIFSLVSLVMIIPFLELLFDRRQTISEKPDFDLSVQSGINQFYYFMGQYMETHGKEQTLIWFCVIVVIVFFLKNLFRYLALYCMAPVRNGVVQDLRRDLYQKIVKLPLNYFSKEKKGDLISRMNADIIMIENSIMSTIEVIFKEPFTIFVYLMTMLFMSVQLTAFVLVMIVLTGVLIGQIGRTLKRKSHKGQEKLGIITSILDETIGGLRIIKAFNAESELDSKFQKENRRYFQISNSILRRQDLSSPLSEVLAIMIVSVMLWFGGKLVLNIDYNLEAETFIGFMLIFSQLIPPAKKFASSFYKIQRGLASSQRIISVMESDEEKINRNLGVQFSGFDHDIKFENVCFKYEENHESLILNDINLHIEKGKMIALVGQSGAGKSTMVDLLPRFYDPISGSIKIDGIDIKDIDLPELRSLFGIVSQDPILFNDTIYNNIALGGEFGKEEVIRAAKIANAHDFISNFEESYNTIVGDRGLNLSGGERQRITIARAVLKNPPILILDEATSSLDSESEKLVQNAIFKLMENRTSIVIAHRLSTIQNADEILVMQDGTVVEQGHHLQLLEKDGVYRRLVQLQQF